MRREWIEIFLLVFGYYKYKMSPSMRREWIEISNQLPKISVTSRLPPCGGSGLK